MPDWIAINKRKRREVNLGMAKKGAILLLKEDTHWSKLYKETVRTLFLMNDELDKEILEGDKALTKDSGVEA